MKDMKVELAIGNSYYYGSNLTIGIYLNEGCHKAILIDSGINEDEAKRIDHFVKLKGYSISSVIVTHGHMAQLGGLPYFKRQYKDLRVITTAKTIQFIENRSLENWMSGHIPCVTKDIQEEQIQDMVTDIIPYYDHHLDIDGISVTIVTLAGHFPGMIGIVTPDQVFYCADALFGNKTLNKQKLLYYTDIQGAKASLDKLNTAEYVSYVLSHGGKYNDLTLLIQQHQYLISETFEFILEVIRETPMTLETIVQRVIRQYELKNTPANYALANSIVRSYLTELDNESKLRASVDDGLLYYYDCTSAIPV